MKSFFDQLNRRGICLSLLGLGFGMTVAAQQPVQSASGNVLKRDANGMPAFVRFSGLEKPTAAQVESTLRALYGARNQDGWTLLGEETDQLGFVHQKYQQTLDGVPVFGAVLKAHIRNGLVESVSGHFEKDVARNSAGMDAEQALAQAIHISGAQRLMWDVDPHGKAIEHATSGKRNSWKKQPELCYVRDYIGNSDGLRLAWKVEVYSVEPLFRAEFFLDARTGELLLRNELLHSADAHGVGHSRYSGVLNIVTDSVGSYYRLRESGRAQGVETYNMLNGTDYQAAVDFEHPDNVWDTFPNAYDNSAIDAHWGAEMTHDYFAQYHGRNSYDDAGSKLISYIHYSNSYSNAFWNGNFMTYGDGGSNSNPFQGLDVCGHEFAHGVTQYSAGLIYQNEPGALNESFSDIFGNSIEFWARPANASWRIGDDIGAFRSMSDPQAYQNPDTYLGSYWAVGAWDNGGVHINSGVQNHWYYLLSVGGSGTNDNGDSYNVTGIGIDSAAAIAYRNLTVYLSPGDGYAEARFYAIQAAIDLFGECSQQMKSTMDAWYAVGVGQPYTGILEASFYTPDTNICVVPATVQFTNLSQSAISYEWQFGDGSTSTLENPSHTYQLATSYTITLIATGCFGTTDTIELPQHVVIDLNQPCTVNMPSGSDTLTQTGCEGHLYDSGGNDDYLVNSNSRVTIQPGGNTQVQLVFSVFNFAPGDRVTIYDGPSIQSPQIGVFAGNTLPPPILSTSGALTIKESTNGAVNREGFVADWSCLVANDPGVAALHSSVYPNPNEGIFQITWHRTGHESNRLVVVDGLGRSVLDRSGEHQGLWSERIDMKEIPSGIYFLHLEAGDTKEVHRLVVQ